MQEILESDEKIRQSQNVLILLTQLINEQKYQHYFKHYTFKVWSTHWIILSEHVG